MTDAYYADTCRKVADVAQANYGAQNIVNMLQLKLVGHINEGAIRD